MRCSTSSAAIRSRRRATTWPDTASGFRGHSGAVARAPSLNLEEWLRPKAPPAPSAQAATTSAVDVVLIGLPGSGKSAVGRRLAHRHDAQFVDLDDAIERAAGQTIPEIFADQGEGAFRSYERAAVEDLGPAGPDPRIRRVVATGGGAVVDPRNRWSLYRGRLAVWLDGRPEVLAQRLRRSPNVRPLVAGRDPIGVIRSLARDRERFYAAAPRLNSAAELMTLVERID